MKYSETRSRGEHRGRNRGRAGMEVDVYKMAEEAGLKPAGTGERPHEFRVVNVGDLIALLKVMHKKGIDSIFWVSGDGMGHDFMDVATHNDRLCIG